MSRALLAAAALALTGCPTFITSAASSNGGAGKPGGFWYVRDTTFSSAVFYCPPQTQVGSHRCLRATMVDDARLAGPDPAAQPPPPGYQQAPPAYQQPYQQPAPGVYQPPPSGGPMQPQPAPAPATQPAPYQPQPYQPQPAPGQPQPNPYVQPSPYAPPAAPPRTGGCVSDADCKSGRVCRQGACTSR